MRKIQHMCPQCGKLFGRLKGSLIPVHPDLRPIDPAAFTISSSSSCPGSEQNPRNPLSDRRPLWNGEPNKHAA